MRYERVKVTRDPHTVYNRAVLPWEIAVLEFMFEEGNVERQNAFEENDAPYPEPAAEFQRLSLAYGSDPQSGVPHAASVYGQASAGVRALKRAMDEAKAEAAAARPKQLKRRRREFASDPLMA